MFRSVKIKPMMASVKNDDQKPSETGRVIPLTITLASQIPAMLANKVIRKFILQVLQVCSASENETAENPNRYRVGTWLKRRPLISART